MSIKAAFSLFIKKAYPCPLHAFAFLVINLLSFTCTHDASGQCDNQADPENFKIVYNQDDIKFNYWIYYSGKTTKQYNKNNDAVNIFLKDIGEGSLFVRIGPGVKIDGGAKLIFKNKFVKVNGCGLVKKGSTEKTFDNKTKGNLCYEFPINRNYEGTINIGFEFVEKKAEPTGIANHSFSIRYKITEFDSQQEKDHQAALETFKDNKEDGIAKMKAYQKNYSSGNCFTSFDRQIKEHDLVEQIRNLHINGGKEECLKLCNKYLQVKYIGGNWEKEISNIKKGLEKRDPKPKKKKKKDPKPTKPSVEKWKKEWDGLIEENSPCPEPYKKFLEKYQDVEVAEEARQLIQERSTMNLQVSLESNKVKVTGPAGSTLKWKDLSLDGELKTVNAFGNIIVASFDAEGEYFLLISDECGRDSTIRLTSDFSAKLTTVEEGESYKITISGGEPPYQVKLLDMTTKEEKNRLDNSYFQNQHEVVIPREYFVIRQLVGGFGASVSDSNGISIIASGQIRLVEDPVDFVLIIMILFTVVAVGLILYLLAVYIQAKRRKETIYDVEY